MIDALPVMPKPKWLLDAIGKGGAAECHLEALLEGSLYYPACGLDGTPLKYLAGNIRSFVYADYEMTKAAYLDNINCKGKGCGFLGYHSVLQREIVRADIVPLGWRPSVVPSGRFAERVRKRESGAQPFGHWSVWVRDCDSKADPRADAFSLLYLAGEMSAVYQGLYSRLGIAPKVLAIIQPGTMGGEWEAAAHDGSFFKSVVGSNPAGMPQYLLNGGYGPSELYASPCWSDYQCSCLARLPERSTRLWEVSECRTRATGVGG
jgi:hypothetical protein